MQGVKMILTIYCNGEKVNKIIENKKSEVYKQLASALFHGHGHNNFYKEEKIKNFDFLNNVLKFSRVINVDLGDGSVTKYKYDYIFYNVQL